MSYVTRTDNPYYDADCWQDEIEDTYKYRPHCSWCDAKITSDYAYRVGSDLLCEECFQDYTDEIREDMITLDEDEAYKEFYDDEV